jgi:hypothetical protein
MLLVDRVQYSEYLPGILGSDSANVDITHHERSPFFHDRTQHPLVDQFQLLLTSANTINKHVLPS